MFRLLCIYTFISQNNMFLGTHVLFGSGGADGAGKCESLRVLRKCGSWNWNKKIRKKDSCRQCKKLKCCWQWDLKGRRENPLVEENACIHLVLSHIISYYIVCLYIHLWERTFVHVYTLTYMHSYACTYRHVCTYMYAHREYKCTDLS